MKEKRIAFIASVKEREEQLKIVINSLYEQVDKIHLVLNWYDAVPFWLIDKSKIHAHLNPENKNAHDSVWQYIDAENSVTKINHQEKYYFVCDDDLFYPADYIEKLINAIEQHGRRNVITVHGSNIQLPAADYLDCRVTYGFSDGLERDIFVDLAGCGTVAFHSSAIKPTLQDFPIPYCRDLFFSILCAKRDVQIVSLQRSANWIMPLKTSGDTIWDITHSNKNLRQLKNRILKEQLLPLLFCNQNCDDYCLITDYDFDERLLKKSLETLSLSTTQVCNKVVFSNQLKSYAQDILTEYVTPEEFAIGRMGSKVLTQYRFIKNLKNGSRVISADADLYYLKDPFTAFEKDFDIAITTRPEQYHYPVNGGVVMFRVSNKARAFLDFIIGQIFERTWPELIDYQDKFGHTGNDWYIDQDIWSVAWLNKKLIEERFGVKIIDVGSEYNFCPHADGIHTWSGKQRLLQAYKERKVSVLHLKSKLRELFFDGEII